MDSSSSSSSKNYILLEITLISAQDLPKPKALRRLHSYATISAGGGDGVKLRTGTDRDGAANPTWNDKFVFRLPAASLSSASLDVEILAAAPWHCLPTSLLGSVRLLLSNHPLLLRRGPHHPIFSALGIRRPSGRFRGVLNVGLTALSRVPNRVAEALEATNAVAYRDLMAVSLKELNSATAMATASKFDDSGKEKENRQPCGLGLGRMQIHSSPSDQNLQISCGGDDEKGENEMKR